MLNAVLTANSVERSWFCCDIVLSLKGKGNMFLKGENVQTSWRSRSGVSGFLGGQCVSPWSGWPSANSCE